jgi:glycoprotein endo-alpha-1,2-mannosidase
MRIFIAVAMMLSLSQMAFAQTTQPAGTYNLDGKAPYLVAHYMMWFSTPWSESDHSPVDRTTANWTHWGWKGKGSSHDPETKLPNGRRDIASIVYPSIGPYDSGSRAVVRYHLSTMKAAGVSVVSDLWYGPKSNTDTRLPILLDEAQKLNMRVFICYEEKINFQGYRHPATREEAVKSAENDLTYILNTYAKHPAYLQRNGLPIIQQFNGFGKDPVVGSRNYTPEEWRTIFATLPAKVEYIRQNLEESYHPTIPAAYVWWDQGDWPKRFANRAGELREQGKLDFFMTMVCPGFNDTGVWGWGDGPRVSKGYGLDVLDTTMKQALTGGPELVQMVTWNYFNEGTCFEPTVQNGTHFLESLGTWWHNSTGKEIHLDQLPATFEQYKKECSDKERAEIPGV